MFSVQKLLQGGNFFEIFSAQGKDPTGQWKLQGGAGIRKVSCYSNK